MTFTVSIAGASGYAGGELLRLVAAHPELALGPMAAGNRAGHLVTEIHPQLIGLADARFVPTDADTLAAADLVLMALPHGESAALVAGLPEDLPIVDLGADFRLADGGAWDRYYASTPHAGTWPYGLPELPGQRSRLADALRVANPGCYATSVALGLAPLLAAGLVEPTDLVVVAASGASGAGRTPSAALLASEVMGSMSPYKVGGVHQHTPEMEQTLGAAAGEPVTILFTPTLAPMPRGILATCTARTVPGVDEDTLRDALHAAYDPELFVHVLPAGVLPRTAATVGSNSVHLQVACDAHSGRTTVLVALDNLVKGAAGQALQNANTILGLPEALGLPVNGVAP
ncbi:MAG: N-acetyl-gamma-glutamyl-phosphate reductase [Candidatus Nanopelagicales bacterium]